MDAWNVKADMPTGRKKVSMTQRGRLLEIIVKKRMEKALDRALNNSKEYQSALKEQDKAFKRVDGLHLRNCEKKIFGGAVYGEEAYRLGMRDGLRLSMEIRAVCG